MTITDANATLGTCTPANGSSLAPGRTITCSATHTVTQADIDAGHYLNTACVSATDATATCDDADVPSDNNPNLSIERGSPRPAYGAVGDVLHYTIVATNVGNVTLHNVVVTDPKVLGSDLAETARISLQVDRSSATRPTPSPRPTSLPATT